MQRDYGLLGEDGRRAVDSGLSNASWVRVPVERKRLKQLMQRSDGPALRNTALWLGLIVASGVFGVSTWRSWWSIPIFVAIPWVPMQVQAMLKHAFTGRVAEDEKQIIPESKWGKVIRDSRIITLIHVITVALAVLARSWLPLLLSIGPSMYGAWFMAMVALTQHVGLADDVTDFRLNTRTVYMNPVFRFLYWNMNYHLEHHMYPMVPFHALAGLHEEIKDQCPPTYNGTLAVYRELIPTLRAQLRDPAVYIHRPLPAAR